MEQSIEALREVLVGRRVVAVERRVYPASDGEPELAVDFPFLVLDDGSEVDILSGDGNPPMIATTRANVCDV